MTQNYTQLVPLAEAICRSFHLEARTHDGRILVDRGMGLFEVRVFEHGETSHRLYGTWNDMLDKAGGEQDINLRKLAYAPIWLPIKHHVEVDND